MELTKREQILVEALRSCIQMGEDLMEMAPHIIDIRDLQTLKRYAGHLQSVPRHALERVQSNEETEAS